MFNYNFLCNFYHLHCAFSFWPKFMKERKFDSIITPPARKRMEAAQKA